MHRNITWPVLLVSAALGAACTIADDDRCPEGWEYRPIPKLCYLIEAEDTEEPGDTETEDGGGDDAGDNFGIPCSNDLDCQDGVADYCMAEPNSDGICTYTNCTPGSCPQGFQCCNCSNFMGLPIMCVSDAQVDAFMGKTCTSCD